MIDGKKASRDAPRLDHISLQKLGVRVISKRLYDQGDEFSFRRCNFQAMEAKVTLAAPKIHPAQWADHPLSFDFSVNYTCGANTGALLDAILEVDVRAKDLVHVVRRWIKDRGLCHISKGCLSPHGWVLLVIYFLQVGLGESPILPALRCAEDSRGPLVTPTSMTSSSTLLVGELFVRFLHFFADEMQWESEVVDVQAGSRCAPSQQLRSHKAPDRDGSLDFLPFVENPFHRGENLGSMMTADAFKRTKEEFVRGCELLKSDTEPLPRLEALLEPYVPPGRFGPKEDASAQDASAGDATAE